MHGWVLCSDGRYHHPVVAEKVRDAWASKLLQRWRTECSRIKKHNDRHGTDVHRPSYEEWLADGRPTGQLLPVAGDGDGPEDGVPGDSPCASRGQGRAVPADGATKRKRQGQGDPDVLSLPDGRASPASPAIPASPVGRESSCGEIIFGYGLSLLVNSGTPERQARSFLGGLRKAHGDEALVDRLRACAQARPLQPLEWLAAALPPPSARKERGAVPATRHGAAYAAIMEG